MTAQERNQLPQDTESTLVKLIRNCYLQEQAETNGDATEQHICGVIAAVRAIYQLGYSQGFTAGAQYVREQGEKE